MSRWRKHTGSILLVAAAVGLGVYAYVDRESVTDSERAARPKNVFPAFRRDALERIELRKTGETLVLARELRGDAGADANWRLESPKPGPTDPAAVEQLSGALEFASFVRKVEPKSAPTFDAPRVSGSITMGKLVYRFALGGAAPTPEGASYFKVDGEGVFVVSKELTEQLLRGADAYESRTVVPYLSLDLASLEVKSEGVALRLERAGELTFKLADSHLRASRERLDKLWSALSELRAEAFVSDDEASRATEKPVLSIEMTPKDDRPRGEILIGGPCAGHPDDLTALRTAPTRLGACVPKGVLEGLSQKPADLVDDRLFFAHEDEVEELRLENAPGDVRIELARKGSGWHARAPFDRDLAGDEIDAANGLASGVIRAKGTGAGPAGSEPFNLRAKVTVHGGEAKDDEVVELGDDGHGKWLVHRKADGARLAVSDEVARWLQPSKAALKGRDVIVPALDPKDVTSLSLRCGTPQDLGREYTQFKLTTPAGLAPDQAGALDLVDQLARLRAERWVADADDGSFGLARSTCSATMLVKAEGGTRTIRVRVGREGEGGVYAVALDQLPGGPQVAGPVFFVPRTLRESLERILIDRSVVGLEPSRATRIELVRGAARVVLERQADRLVGPDAGLATGVEALEAALGGLRADDVVHLGPPAADEGFGAPSFEIRAELEGDAGRQHARLRFGRDVLRKNQPMVLCRADGVDATFAVAKERVDPLRNAF
ncbi:MAG TPA: DUF4340 domain-containing protein [Polyangiaceae bacterium]|nr:DUF4340 domain-containing protein [Polyangiaceae bacterium]